MQAQTGREASQGCTGALWITKRLLTSLQVKCWSSRFCTRNKEVLYAFCACNTCVGRCTAGGLELPEEHGSEEASVNGGLVHHDRVLLVVATIACNGHNGIVPRRQLPAHQLCTLKTFSTASMAGDGRAHWSSRKKMVRSTILLLITHNHWNILLRANKAFLRGCDMHAYDAAQLSIL